MLFSLLFSLTFSFQQLELLSSSEEVLPKDNKDDGQGDGSDEDVRPHDGHGEDGPRNDQCQLMQAREENMSEQNSGTFPTYIKILRQ